MAEKIGFKKYVVMEQDDIDKYLNDESKCDIKAIINKIRIGRLNEGKRRNKYVVLNATNEIDLNYLMEEIKIIIANSDNNINESQIKDIAFIIVTAILNLKS